MRGILKRQVESILKEDERSRNSDIRLMLLIWVQYYPQFLYKDENDKWCIKLRNISDVPREDHISRIRRKIQEGKHGKPGKYLPTSPQVRAKRKILEEECRAYYREH